MKIKIKIVAGYRYVWGGEVCVYVEWLPTATSRVTAHCMLPLNRNDPFTY